MDILYADTKEAKPSNKIFCQQLEETALSAYEAAIKRENWPEKDAYELIVRQKDGIKHSLSRIKSIGDKDSYE